jgi:uncharacterized membrane protein YheB (UPF0754 family)
MTNWVAIKMLFYPRYPKNIFGLKLQGLIPRRQRELADQCATIIERELLQQDFIEESLKSVDLKPMIEQKVRVLIRQKLGEKLKSLPMLGAFINEATLSVVEEMAVKEMGVGAEELLHEYSQKVSEKIQIKKIIEERILGFDLDKLEGIVIAVASKEFKVIEFVGALLGFMIGLSQVIFLSFF